MHLQQGFDDLREAFDNAGVHLTHDPRDLQLPGALANPQMIERRTLGTLSVDWEIHLIAPDNGHPLAALDDMLANLNAHGLFPTNGEFVNVSLPNLSPDPLPAIKLAFNTEN